MRRSSSSRHIRRLSLAGALGLILVLALAGCQIGVGPLARPAGVPDVRVAATPDGVAARPTAEAATRAEPVTRTAKLQLSPPKAEVGATVQLAGSGYPANSNVELVWYTVDGRYEIEGGSEFIGQRVDPHSSVLTTLRADATGNIAGPLTVPQDFGGAHDLRGRVDGQELSQASLTIQPTFKMEPSSGPIGTSITVTITGVDSRPNINTWQVLYDNSYLGFMSAVTTRGVATAKIRAAGPAGDHRISVWHNSFNSIPYLNWQQGPYKDVPNGDFVFHVTAGASDPDQVRPFVEAASPTDVPWKPDVQTSGTMRFTQDRGMVGEPTTLEGTGLPADADIRLRWMTMVGNRVSAIGFTEDASDLATVRTDSAGRFSHQMTIPDDLGGQHRVDAFVGETLLATTGLVIQPSVVGVEKRQARVGEQVAIHLKGVGWTTYDNTYAVTYDNSYIGYVCGFSTAGDVQFTVTATGQRGTHIVDLYPTIYKGKDAQPRVYSVPQLTYRDDHPGRLTPAIRLTIEIVD